MLQSDMVSNSDVEEGVVQLDAGKEAGQKKRSDVIDYLYLHFLWVVEINNIVGICHCSLNYEAEKINNLYALQAVGTSCRFSQFPNCSICKRTCICSYNIYMHCYLYVYIHVYTI